MSHNYKSTPARQKVRGSAGASPRTMCARRLSLGAILGGPSYAMEVTL